MKVDFRDTADDSKVLVLGGKGFIGRHAVRHLLTRGVKVTVGTRKVSTWDEPADVPQARFLLHEALTKEDWQAAAETFDVILNCVGILRQRLGESYEAVHHLAPRAIAMACAEEGTRFVHVSALGLSADAKSRFLTSKFRGERAIRDSSADWIIARLSLLDGEGGYGAAWLRGVAKSPLFVVPRSAKGYIAALTAEDAGQALSELSLADSAALKLGESRIFELGGQYSHRFEQYIRALRLRYFKTPAVSVPIPGWLARLGAHLCDMIHFSPFSFGHWELLCRDNTPSPNRLPELLGRPPQPVVPSPVPRPSR
ncbi:MAG: NAD(P)H-binding protein [Pseudomonadota bacterium]